MSFKDGYTFGRELTEEEMREREEHYSLHALDNQLKAPRDDADPITMTAGKLEHKLPGMASAALQLDDPSYARFRDEDEAILKEEQTAWRESHPKT